MTRCVCRRLFEFDVMQSTMHSCIFVLVKSIAPAVTPWFLATPQAEGWAL